MNRYFQSPPEDFSEGRLHLHEQCRTYIQGHPPKRVADLYVVHDNCKSFNKLTRERNFPHPATTSNDSV